MDQQICTEPERFELYRFPGLYICKEIDNKDWHSLAITELSSQHLFCLNQISQHRNQMLENLPTLDKAIALDDLEISKLVWVQSRLAFGGYLAEDSFKIGEFGIQTLKAFNEFKEDLFQDQLGIIGQGSIQILAQLKAGHNESEQNQPRVLKPIGIGRTGKFANVPGLGSPVYANEEITPGSKLTWGELTAGLTRLPIDSTLTKNLITYSKIFGEIRSAFGSAIAVTSGYRPPAVNKAIGGSKNSFHIRGQAGDLYALNGDLKGLRAIVLKHKKVGEVGLAKTFIHVAIGSDREIFRYSNK